MKHPYIKKYLAMALCFMFMLTARAAYAAGTRISTNVMKNPKLRIQLAPPITTSKPLRIPIPTGEVMHARVVTGEGYLLVYDNTMLSGNVLGRLLDGDITTVEVYTCDVARVIGASAELNGGFVRLSLLEEIPDENSFPEGEPYQAVIKADPITGGPVDVWLNYDLKGEKIGTVMPGETVTAQNYDCGYSAEIILPSGETGFVALESLTYLGPCSGI